TYEAGSYLKAGEADQAAAAAAESLTLANKIGAPRCVALVRELAPGFNKYAGADGVNDLLERVRTS
ncbi:XRE family transcriptional regulator, partial [Streptomyces sp. DT225]